MTTRKDRPGVETEAIEVQAGRLSFESSLAAPSDIAPYDYPLDPIYEAKLLAWAQGWESRRAEVYRLNSEADRYYRAAYNPRPKIDPNRPSYSQLERIRGGDEHADEIDAANAVRFAGVL